MGYLDDDFGPAAPKPGPVARVRLGAIGEAWDLVRRQSGAWALAVLVQFLCIWALNEATQAAFGRGLRVELRVGPPRLHASRRGPGHFAQAVAMIAVNGFFVGGMIRMGLKQLRGRPIAASDLFSVADVLPNLMLASFLVALAIGVGAFFCLVPGLIVAGLLMLTLPLVVDARLDAVEALRRSVHALQGQWLSATLFHLVALFLAGIGVVFCYVGLLFTAPIYSLSLAVLYRDTFLRKP
jgi:hypothetical protein